MSSGGRPTVKPLASGPPPRTYGRKSQTSSTEHIPSTCSAAPYRSGAAEWHPPGGKPTIGQPTTDYLDGAEVPTTSSSCPVSRKSGARDANHDKVEYPNQRQSGAVFTKGQISAFAGGAATALEARPKHHDQALVNNLREVLSLRLPALIVSAHHPPPIACQGEAETPYGSWCCPSTQLASQQDIAPSEMQRPRRPSSEARAPMLGQQANNDEFYVNARRPKPQPRPRERRCSEGTRSAPATPKCPRKLSERLPVQQYYHPAVKTHFSADRISRPVMESGAIPTNSHITTDMYCYTEAPLLNQSRAAMPATAAMATTVHATMRAPTQGDFDVLRETNIFISDVASNAFTQHQIFTPRFRFDSFGHRLEYSVDELKAVLGAGIPVDVTRGQYYSDAIHTIMSNWRDKCVRRGDTNLKQTLIRYLFESQLTPLINQADLPPVQSQHVESYLTSDVVSEQLTVAKQATSSKEDSGFGSGGNDVYSYAEL